MTESERQRQLRANWTEVLAEVQHAVEKSGRTPESVRIIGVAKYVDAETTNDLVNAGCHNLGESRPQVIWEKAEALNLPPTVSWHLIGHLQRNKIRRVLKYQPVIHSVDSQRLLDAVAAEAVRRDQTVTVLLEANISGDESKTGLDPETLKSMMDQIPAHGVDVVGLMAMSGLGSTQAIAQQQFAEVRDLRDRLEQASGRSLPELSMGMSGDFAQAIAEGATMVRIGSRLFQSIID